MLVLSLALGYFAQRHANWSDDTPMAMGIEVVAVAGLAITALLYCLYVVSRFEAHHHDVFSARNRKETTFKELTAHLEALGEHAITATTDTAGTIIYANSKFSEVSGYSNAELIGQNHRILNSGYHPKSFFTEMYKTVATGKTWRGEIRNRAKDGALYWVDTTISPLKDHSGKVYRYLSIRTVSTNRKLSEETLKRNLNILNTTFNNFPGGISVFTGDLKLQFANPAFYKLLDFLEERFPIGTPYADIIRYDAERGEYGDGNIDALVHDRVELALKFEEHSFKRALPNGKNLEIKGWPIPEGGFITTYTDVTEIELRRFPSRMTALTRPWKTCPRDCACSIASSA